ncbi:MAG: pyridoxamine 5'-phosphate oxidase family protein [Actinomycetota bacterium]|nr:pyridoxamine 5'-phosphate oxidase family protein [Actinomycetota bacterium]
MADWRDGLSREFATFWAERRICLLTTPRPDGTPHLVPVGATLDLATGIVRVITRRHSRKVANIRTAGPTGASVAVGQVEGGRWCTVEGLAVVREDRMSVAEAERRYAQRYRVPEPNPERVVIEIEVRRLLGSVR